jgi:hypothetical protein
MDSKQIIYVILLLFILQLVLYNINNSISITPVINVINAIITALEQYKVFYNTNM